MSSTRHHLAVVVAVVASAVLPACLVLDRTAALAPGSVRGEARFGGEGRADVGVVLANSRFAQRTVDDGDFLIGDLPGGSHALRLQEDDDNDGVIDRGAAVGFAVGQFNGGLAGVDLGPVAMRGTVTISGAVEDEDGAGLAGLVVVITRFELDRTAEVIVPLVDDDGDGRVEYSVRGVVPGTVEVQAIASGSRASEARALTVRDDGDQAGIDLAVRAVAPVAVNTNVNPLLPTARFSIVAPDAGPRAAAIAGNRVGVDAVVDAGIYDVWFFADDGAEPIAFLPRQVARDLDATDPAPLVWGPALRGAVSGVTGDENTAPDFTATSSDTRLLVTRDNAVNDFNATNVVPHVLAFAVVDPDGDDVTVTAVQPEGPLSVIVEPNNTVRVRLRDDASAAEVDAAIFSRTPIRLSLDDGHDAPVIVTVGTAILADAVFVGRPDLAEEGTFMFNEENWLASSFAPTGSPRDVVFEGPSNATGDQDFHNIDVRSSIDLATGRLSVFSVFAGTSDARIHGDGQLLLLGTTDDPAVLNGRVEDCSILIDGFVRFGSGLNIVEGVGGALIEFTPGATLEQLADTQNVFIQVPFTLDSASTFRAAAGAVVHFTRDVVLDGNVEFDPAAGMAFGIPGEDNDFTLSGTGFGQGVGTASFAGNVDAVITIATSLSAPTSFKVFDAVTVTALDIDGAPVGEIGTTNLQVEAPAVVRGDFFIGALRAPGVACTASGRIDGNVTVSSTLQLGELDVGSFDLVGGATVRFGAGTLLRTSFFNSQGTIDLAGGGQLEVRGNDDAILFDEGTVITSVAPNEHELSMTSDVLDEDVVTFNSTAGPLDLDIVRVAAGRRCLQRSGEITVNTLVLEAGASAAVDSGTPEPILVVDTCEGDGAPEGCPVVP